MVAVGSDKHQHPVGYFCMHWPSTKAQMLSWLQGRLKGFEIPKAVVFTVDEWQGSPASVFETIHAAFGGGSVAIRSSAIGEDGEHDSMAGEFASVLNIKAADFDAIAVAVNEVVDSYAQKSHQDGRNEILVQAMVWDVSLSGVLFTCEPNQGAPYYVINYDDVSGLTTTVTAGTGSASNKLLYVYRDALDKLKSPRFFKLVSAVVELERVLDCQLLDIEFAIDDNETPILLQVRRITTHETLDEELVSEIEHRIGGIESFLAGAFGPVSGILGGGTIFGQMPDWNPAEIIGRVPKALSMSLYRVLIMNSAWRVARSEMGYREPVGQPLMVSLGGQPYIDVRLSLNSFLPRDLSPEIGAKLVEKWISMLIEKPNLHDKIEFDVATTCYRFDMDSHFDATISDLLTAEERRVLSAEFLKQTRSCLLGAEEGTIDFAYSKLAKLPEIRLDALDTDMRQLRFVLESCERFGTIPFAILARHGFIAVSMLKSLRSLGILSEQDEGRFLQSVETVATDFVDDMSAVQKGDKTSLEFLEKFGHLRPGTYDILSERYDAVQSSWFTDGVAPPSEKHTFALSEGQIRDINDLLATTGWGEMDAIKLFDYFHVAIAGREYSKFRFTKVLSAAIELIARIGERYGLSREQMAHVPVETLLDLHDGSTEVDIAAALAEVASREMEKFRITSCIRLPQLLHDLAGVRVIPFQISQPNFVTSKKVSAPVLVLESGGFDKQLGQNIIAIENADPGFDWILSQDIAGLVTKFGGANSHMAIRCAEFGLPAAIGCGERLFEQIKEAGHITLDCSAGLIFPSR